MPTKAAAKRSQHLAMLMTAQDAYDNPSKASPHLPTSDMDCSFRIGRWMRNTDMPRPAALRPSHPSTYHVTAGHTTNKSFKVKVPWNRLSSPYLYD